MMLTFSQDDSRTAYEEWGANCGPNALAFALQVSLEDVRSAIPGFDQRRYTSPTMMLAALKALGRRFHIVGKPSRAAMFSGQIALVRIQWTGPWIVDGKPQRWAARQTHWIVTWTERCVPLVFDVNCGIVGIGTWENEIVPRIVSTMPRADGGWYPANIWRL